MKKQATRHREDKLYLLGAWMWQEDWSSTEVEIHKRQVFFIVPFAFIFPSVFFLPTREEITLWEKGSFL